MMKMRSLALSIDEALQERGVPAPAARTAAEIGVTIWRVAIEQWSTDKGCRGFLHHIRSAPMMSLTQSSAGWARHRADTDIDLR
jgi:hypothetical protein